MSAVPYCFTSEDMERCVNDKTAVADGKGTDGELMSKVIKYIKILIVFADVFCIVMSFRFLTQAEQRNMVSQEKGEYDENGPILELSESLAGTEAAFSELLSAYEETRKQIEEAEEIYEALENVYGFKAYVDDTAAELYRGSSENPDSVNPYIERYFMVGKDELRQKLGNDTFPSLAGAEDYGVFLPVGEGIWLRYEQDGGNVGENADVSVVPIGIVITNPQINVGYGEAKVGMTIHDIEDIFKEGNRDQVERREVRLGEENASYLCFQDEHYAYYYLSTDGVEWLQPTTLYITRRAG